MVKLASSYALVSLLVVVVLHLLMTAFWVVIMSSFGKVEISDFVYQDLKRHELSSLNINLLLLRDPRLAQNKHFEWLSLCRRDNTKMDVDHQADGCS